MVIQLLSKKWSGKIYVEVNRFFPSSKTCSNCLHQVDNISLNIRSWQCPKCKTLHDKDINAAVNIKNEGLGLLARGHLATASGQRVRPSFGTAFRGNVG
ncbi:transposase [Nostoc sp.]|uniref:transposase n=1 Tax=Nostoc sp. TaxID=1180 RepID=UPI002FFBEBF6